MANRWDPENIIEPSIALEMIKNQFPKLDAQKIEYLGAGYDNTTYLINDEYVFRFPRKSVSAKLLENEIYILPKIAEFLPCPISLSKWAGKPDKSYPWIFAGYKKLLGQSACSLNLSDSALSTFAKPLGKFLAALHSIPIKEEYKQKLPDDSKIKLDKTLVLTRIRTNLEKVELVGLLENKKELYDLLNQMENLPLPHGKCIVHGDLYSRHLLVHENKLSGIIDWGDVHIGDLAVDISIAYSFLPYSAHEDFEDAYGEISEETWSLAKLRAFHIGAVLIVYGNSIKDQYLIREGYKILKYLLEPLHK